MDSLDVGLKYLLVVARRVLDSRLKEVSLSAVLPIQLLPGLGGYVSPSIARVVDGAFVLSNLG
jgi:hypothetical protein